MYKVRGTDGKEYGPVSADVLRQWLTERRLTPQTMVQPAGSIEWRPISAYPELAAFISGTSTQAPVIPSVPSLPPGTGPAASTPAPGTGTQGERPPGAPAYPTGMPTGAQPQTSGLAITSLI